MLKDKVPISRRKNLLAILTALVLLVGAAGYFVYISKEKNTTLSKEEKSKVSSVIDESRCAKDMDSVNKINTRELKASDAASVYNYRGNCYFERKDYKKSLQAFEQARDACNKAGNQKCAQGAEESISTVKRIVDSASSQSDRGSVLEGAQSW